MFNWFSGEKKDAKSEIDKLEDFVSAASNIQVSVEDYPAMRLEFNIRMIGAVLGMDFDRDKDGNFKIVSIRESPDSDDIFEIMGIADDFLTNVESRFNIEQKDYINEPEKVNDKNFCDIVFGNITNCLSIRDFVKIGRMGSNLRQYRKDERNSIIAGIAIGTVIVIGGVVYMKQSARL